jgi:O-antigen/teichoic acid export membrane protein
MDGAIYLMSRRGRRWISADSTRTLWAVCDQCIVSGGNFFTNLILVRNLAPVDFGTYALILNAILFFNSVHQALVTYPVCVRGARAGAGQLGRLLAFALVTTVLLTLTVLGPALSAIAVSLRRPAIISAAVAAMLFWQLQDTMRAAFIAKLEQRRALIGDAISYVGQAILLALVFVTATPTLVFVLWTISGTSLLALLVQSWQIRLSVPLRRNVRPLSHQFWILGRWSVVAKLVGFLTLQAFPWMILVRYGRMEVAAFQAIFQLLALSNPLLFSVGSLVTATVARDGKYQTRSIRNYVSLLTAIVGGYLLLLGVAGRLLMRMLYGSNSQYLGYAPLLWIFALAWLFEMISLLTTAILGGLRQPRSLFIVQFSGAMIGVLVAFPLIYWKGLVAAAFGMLIVNIVRAGIGTLLVMKWTPDLGPNG